MLHIKEQNEIAKTINTLFAKKNFFEKLCDYSNNDINLVTYNIGKIINYYLVTKDTRTSYPIIELLKKTNEVTETSLDILFHPSNSFYLNYYRLNGLNPYIKINNIPKIDLEYLDRDISLFPSYIDICYSKIYSDINEAITESFLCPNSLFKSILKQPKGKELPLVVGTSEKNYYRSILDIRLKNIHPEITKTHTTIAKKALNGIIGKDSVIVLLPKKTHFTNISEKDIKDNITGLFIPPIYLSFIKIPSKYKLLSMCAANKQLRNGELLNINTGEKYELPIQDKQEFIGTMYSRYEQISVTDLFEYTNSEFTGDIDYDIDLIYGQLDSNKSREAALRNTVQNIESIKKRDDITVRKKGNKYEIRNGRHRILYLKHFYVSNYESYKQDNRLHTLKKYVTIPMNVESSIEDEITTQYILKLYYLNPRTEFYKTNINNDLPNLIIVFNNRVYSINSTEEIIELHNYLLQNHFHNKYYICENDSNYSKDYQKIFDYLIINLKEKTYNMDLLDIIRHLINKGIEIDDTIHQLSKLNIGQLYASYVDLQHNLQLQRIFNTKRDIIKKTKNKYKATEVGQFIMNLINRHPKLIELSWDNLYKILITYKELSEYDEEFLRDSADFAGYQKLKLEYILKDEEYTKPPKLW